MSMNGFNVDELQNRNDINEICSDLNKLVRKRYNAKSRDRMEDAEQEIERQAERLLDAYEAAAGVRDPSGETIWDEGKTDLPDDEREHMPALLRSDKRDTKYYTVISKEEARKEIAGLVEYYPEHNFYAVTDVMDEDGEECFTMVMGEEGDNPFGYYPELDYAKTEADRKAVMEGFLSGFEEYYIYSKPDDFFAR